MKNRQGKATVAPGDAPVVLAERNRAELQV
jgi:hypothetical protein